MIVKQGKFILPRAEPAYRQLQINGDLDRKVATARSLLEHCVACPRKCGINRLNNEKKDCNIGRNVVVSSAFPHFGEEYCLSGRFGSGTIFFSSCNLRCVFCQNWDISQNINGQEFSAQDLSEAMLALQQHGCHNINFVTPEHVVPQVVEAIALAIEDGLNIPIVYNTSAYDSLESLELMNGLTDIYMPDFKCWNQKTSARLLGARDYPTIAKESIREMHHQVGDLKLDETGIAFRGLMIRHLVMPGMEKESKSILEWIAKEISPDTYINIMGQYRPSYKVGNQKRDGNAAFAEINRPIEKHEIEGVYNQAREVGLWRFDE
jgi:putative pyruvate formate lyase activating enzyme